MLRVLTFGWEFAPIYSGGLGVACAGLVKALVAEGVAVTFVLPKLPREIDGNGVRLVAASHYVGELATRTVDSLLTAYATTASYHETLRQFRRASGGGSGDLYGADLLAEVARYAEAARRIAAEVPHDVIHCHDWMTFEAGIVARSISGRPLVVHVHATEHDRTGGHGANPEVHARERRGLAEADLVVAVSNYTKRKLVELYGVAPEKIRVVHNAVEPRNGSVDRPAVARRHRIVLFLGRITLQKGPDWFLYAARRVLEEDPGVLFVVAGSGDMEPFLIEKAADLGIGRSVLFTGFLTGEDIDRAYRMADVYVMPSVSEPFGIAPLEAMRHGTPVIISKQSGVSEVIRHCLKVDFWDTEELAAKILGVLYYRELHAELAESGSREVGRICWADSARRMLEAYETVLDRTRS